MNPKVDSLISRTVKWKEEFEQLRSIVLACGLTEELKWDSPCYTVGGSNIVLIHGFKEYCALLFFKGALLSDPMKILIQQTKNVQAARQIRFAHLDEISKLEKHIKAYVKEAVKLEQAGAKVAYKKTSEFPVPEEFQRVLNKNQKLKAAFTALTPGRQRAYLFHFSQPKQTQTRAARVEKFIHRIMEGKGLND